MAGEKAAHKTLSALDHNNIIEGEIMENTKKKPSFGIIVAFTCLLVIACGVTWTAASGVYRQKPTEPVQNVTAEALPAPELAEGLRGQQFGIDKNINEETIDKYLGRSDTIYRDMRMLKDPGNYEAIGGDSYLSGFVKGFEVVPYPYIVNVSNLPAEVGETYTGKTLFTADKDGNLTANYTESMQILEDLFPKDKNIFLMCGGAGYAGDMKKLLVKLGWDADRIYNVGGYWYYEGENNVAVKTTRGGETVYDFWKVPYHDIDFSTLHEIEK